MSAITVVAIVTAQPGAEAALQSILLGLVAPTRLEAGCLRYDLHRDPLNPQTLVFLETWDNRAAHQAHMQTPGFLAARAAQQGLVAGKDVRILEQL